MTDGQTDRRTFAIRGVLISDGLTDRQTDGQTDICDSRVAFATENSEMEIKDEFSCITMDLPALVRV